MKKINLLNECFKDFLFEIGKSLKIISLIKKIKFLKLKDFVIEREKINIFKVNDYEFWAGNTLSEIMAEYKKQTGVDPFDKCDGFDNVYKLEDGDLDVFKISDEDRSNKRTFREELENDIVTGRKFPSFFAGEDY